MNDYREERMISFHKLIHGDVLCIRLICQLPWRECRVTIIAAIFQPGCSRWRAAKPLTSTAPDTHSPHIIDTHIRALTTQELSVQKPQSYIGPVTVGAMAFAPAWDAINLARTIDVQRNQDGIEQALYTWPEAIIDILADFSSDGSVLAARLKYNDIALVGLPEGKVLRPLKFGVDFQELPISLALSPDGSKVAVAMGENIAQIWDVKSGRLLTTLTQPGSGVAYQDLSFSPDGATLLGGFTNTITRWDIASREATTFEPGCRGDAIFDLEFSPDGKHLAIVCGPVETRSVA